jgi:uncharacterized protein YwgA
MTTTKEMVLIGGIARSLAKHGSWCGETHIQKTAFIAKHAFKVALESDFVLYKHGPYSFDLNKSLSHMIARGVLRLETNPGYGPLNEKFWEALNNSAENIFSRYSDNIEKACTVLGSKNVAELERVSTAFYLIDEDPEISDDDGAQKLSQLKPHIQADLARAAFVEAREKFLS